MKTFARLIRRYVLATAGIILVVVALLLGMTIYAGVRYNGASDSVQKVGALAEALHPTADGLQWDAAHTPAEWMHGYAWAMVLDEDGNVIWQQDLPEALNHRYTARTDWIAGVSHDIRTPLALILGWGEQLQQDEALPAAARQKAAGICTQSEKIRSLIGDLNLTSKLQYGAQPLRRKAVTVGPFLRRCAAEFYESPAAGDSTLELELTQAAEHTVVQADEALLLRAIENLLHNAVGHNAVPVHVTIRADAADGMLTIQVTDDGQGYPPAVLAVLQAGETGENPPHILGLHVVEQILAAHGGTAAFAQALPHGAAAALTLPL